MAVMAGVVAAATSMIWALLHLDLRWYLSLVLPASPHSKVPLSHSLCNLWQHLGSTPVAVVVAAGVAVVVALLTWPLLRLDIWFFFPAASHPQYLWRWWWGGWG